MFAKPLRICWPFFGSFDFSLPSKAPPDFVYQVLRLSYPKTKPKAVFHAYPG
jgi:hypothetical protein